MWCLRRNYRSTDITMVIAVVIKYLSFWKSSLVRVCAAVGEPLLLLCMIDSAGPDVY